MTAICNQLEKSEMRDRLIELIKKAKKDTRGANCDLERNMIFADNLLANGVIVPPCKVGDTVFVVGQGAGFSVIWKVYRAKARAIHLNKLGQLFVMVETDRENVGGYVEVERVFLSIEEAQNALEKIEQKLSGKGGE